MSRPIASESAFRAIADPTRRRIIDLLRVLAVAGVVHQRRRGRERVYRAHMQALAPVLQWTRACESRV